MSKAENDRKMSTSANSKKLTLVIIAAALMLCGAFIVVADTEPTDAIIREGDTGKIHNSWQSGDCTVTYDSQWVQRDREGLLQYGEGVLRVSGNGRMADYAHVDRTDCSNTPWTERIHWASPYFGCNKLIIEEGVTHIGSFAFFSLGFSEVVIPSTVKSIGDSAFERTKLTSIVIPDTVTKMGNEVFKDCTKLTSVKLSNSLTTLGTGLFKEVPVASIDIPASVKSMNGTFQFSGIESVVIPKGITEISDYTFWCCKNLKTVVIPDSVKSIGENAFERCAITEIRLENIESIGVSAFQECKDLKCAILSPNLKSLGNHAFSRCSALEYVYIPSTIKTIPDFAFADCALKSVVLPDSIESIGNSAFSNDPLEYINIPNSVKSIGSGAFSNTNMTSVVIPASVKSIGWGTFVTKVLKYVTFEGTDVNIAPFTFICLPEIFNLPATTDPEIAKNIGIFVGVKFYDTDKTTEITPTNLGTIGGYTWTSVGMSENSTVCKIADPKPETLTFTWMNWDGTILQKTSGVALNEWPSYEGADPTNKYGLTFCGWNSIQDRYGNVFLMATYQVGEVTDVGGDDSGVDDGNAKPLLGKVVTLAKGAVEKVKDAAVTVVGKVQGVVDSIHPTYKTVRT